MPTFKAKDYVAVGGMLSSPHTTPKPAPSFDLKVENAISCFWLARTNEFIKRPQENNDWAFNPIDNIPQGYDGYLERFVPAESAWDIGLIKHKIDCENRIYLSTEEIASLTQTPGLPHITPLTPSLLGETIIVCIVGISLVALHKLWAVFKSAPEVHKGPKKGPVSRGK